MKLREGKKNDVAKVNIAITMLRSARNLLKQVGAKKSVERVRFALKSAEGAKRHAERTVLQQEE